jgi:putative salt-induced outer membrane protein YdiY
MKKVIFLPLVVMFCSPALVQAEEPKDVPTPEIAAAATPAVPAPPKDEGWKANVGFSAILNSGNSSNQTFGGNAMVSDKWGRNKVGFAANGAYGRAKDNATDVTTTNTKNWKTVLRYDRYLTDPLSLFAFGHLGSDEPAGFNYRYGAATGLAHELWRTDPNFFKYELGFDYTREERVTPPDQDVYSARTFLQYKYKISKSSMVGEDFEALFDLQRGNNVRLNSLTSLTFTLTEILAFQFGFGVRFDNDPVPGFKKTDTTTQFGLLAKFL